MHLLPTFARELRSAAYRQRWRRQRIGFAVVCVLACIVWLMLDAWFAGGVRFTLAPFLAGVPLLCFVVGWSAGARLLDSERREGTLPLLLLTRLTGHDIVIGKVLQGTVVQLGFFLAAVPALVLPYLSLCGTVGEGVLLALAALNIAFHALTLRLLISALGNARVVRGCLVLLAVWWLFSQAIAGWIPWGPIRELVQASQWLNPCEAWRHASSVAGGFRPVTYWGPLLLSHAVAWLWMGLAGSVLAAGCQREAGIDLGRSQDRGWRRWIARVDARTPEWRARLLELNPWAYLTGRERWPTAYVWWWIGSSAAFFGWAAWAARNLGFPAYSILVSGVAVTWHITLLVMVPAEASRRLVQDRENGMLELVLGTPLSVAMLARGQWQALRCRYLAPTVTVMLLSTVLMLGEVMYGFGNLTPSERGLWLFWWLLNIALLPLRLVAVCWVAMRQTFTAKRAGDASSVAVLATLGLPWVVTLGLYWVLYWSGVELGWPVASWLLSAVYVAILGWMAWRARRGFLAGLRGAAGNR